MVGKTRNPWGVWLLGFTLVYPLIWYFKINKELRDFDSSIDVQPGVSVLAVTLGIPEEEANDLWHLYHERIPYISGIAKYAQLMGTTRGYIKMIDGARRHFTLWQPRGRREEGAYAFLPEAQRRWPGQVLERAFTYQAGNGLIQGSAARQMKRAMVNVYRAGYLPLVTMHDELGNSVSGPKACEEIGEIMCDAVKLVIPVTADLEVGPTWGKAKTNFVEFFR